MFLSSNVDFGSIIIGWFFLVVKFDSLKCVMILTMVDVFGCFSGHGSFSNNPKLNSVAGHLLHSSILVPYHGWYVYAEELLIFESSFCFVLLFVYFNLLVLV